MNTEQLLRFHHISGIENLETYRRCGGYQALTKAAKMSPAEIVTMVERAGLRGRGGAGYPTGRKWRAVLDEPSFPHYFVCNVAEGEPGSFKDRELLRNPHQTMEATAISAYAVGAEKAFIYLRGSMTNEDRQLKQALVQARTAGLLGPGGRIPVEIVIHRGEDNYIAGEETALLESLEGKPAIPRTKPPRPNERGLWDLPTVVNNVETICNTIFIILQGPDSFRRWGTADSPGTKLFCLSGQIRIPGLYELPLGTRLSTLLNEAGGGALPERRLLGVFPGGPSTAFVPVELDPPLDFEGLQAVGSSLGTGGVVVIDDSTDPRKLAVEVSSFFARESCDACPPCTIGTSECHRLFQRIAQGEEIDGCILKIQEFCEMMKVRGNCAHNRAAAFTLLSIVKGFPEAFRS